MRLGLTTRSYSYEWTTEHFKRPGENITVPTDFETVTGITLPDGTTYNNRRHSTALSLRKIITAPRNTSESITLPDDRAIRLVSLFRRLRPGHELECHDFVSEVEQWPGDILDYDIKILGRTQEVTPGVSYSVQSNFGPEDNFDWVYTHSCMATDSGNFLGIVGNGLMLSVMDRESTEKLYARGGEPYIGEIIPPSDIA